MDDASAPQATSRCPGCGLELPRSEFPYTGYYLASRECWSVYTEVLSKEYANAVLFGRIHQRTVDAYAVQHAGGPHPDKSVGVHLVGLYLVLERGVAPVDAPAQMQRLAKRVEQWPHFEPPTARGELTIFDVALADTPQQHETRVRSWSEQVWKTWSEHHAAIARFAELAFVSA